jgi:hypothetical protein
VESSFGNLRQPGKQHMVREFCSLGEELGGVQQQLHGLTPRPEPGSSGRLAVVSSGSQFIRVEINSESWKATWR